MRVYHDLQKDGNSGHMKLTSTCGHLQVYAYMDARKLERHGLTFYMNATETKLKRLIETILKK